MEKDEDLEKLVEKAFLHCCILSGLVIWGKEVFAY